MRRSMNAALGCLAGILAWPACGLIAKDFDGTVKVSLAVDSADRCYEAAITFDPNENEPVGNDGFMLHDDRNYWVRTVWQDGLVRRDICVHDDAVPVVDQQVTFTYARPGQVGEGSVSITTAVPLYAAASADPDTIQPGQAAQLLATASGGVAPYTYAWSPVDGLSATSVANPVASPAATTTYTVEIKDAIGQTRMASVSVTVLAACLPVGAACEVNSQCCSGFCHPRAHTCNLG